MTLERKIFSPSLCRIFWGAISLEVSIGKQYMFYILVCELCSQVGAAISRNIGMDFRWEAPLLDRNSCERIYGHYTVKCCIALKVVVEVV